MNNELSRRLEEAKRLSGGGDHGAALTVLEALSHAHPGDPAIAFERGKELFLLGRHAEALPFLRAGAPLQRDVPVLLAKALKQLQRPIEALGELGPPAADAETERERQELVPAAVAAVRQLNLDRRREEAAGAAERLLPLLRQDDVFNRNRLVSEREIAAGATIMTAQPRNLIVTLTTDCNLRCVMCEWVRSQRWEIPPATLEEVRRYLPYLERVVWQGGEVFLYPGLRGLIEQAGLHPVRQVITTNGLLIDEPWAELLLRNRVDLTFSVDGITREVYESIRKGADFGRLVRNLASYRRMKEALRAEVNTNLHVVVMRSNYRQLESYVDFALEYGFRYMAFLAIGGNYDSPENIFHAHDPAAAAYLRERLPAIFEKAARYGILIENRLPVRVEAPEPGPQDGPAPSVPDAPPAPPRRVPQCFLPWLQMYIDYDGSIRPDCVCRREVALGTVATRALPDAWNSPEMQAYRRSVAAGPSRAICNADCTEERVSQRYLTFS